MKNQNPKQTYGLVCSGGGVLGAYQVGVLKYIHEFFCKDNKKSPFQIFSGISCGSLNAIFYSAEAYQAAESRLWLEELWGKFHIPEYHQNIFKSMQSSILRSLKRKRSGQKSVWTLLSPQPMIDIIDEGFLREHLETSFETGATLGVSVAATEIVSCLPCWFVDGPRAKGWRRFHSIGIEDKITTAHVAASCSVPFFMPPQRIGKHYFVDGSVNLQRPFSAAISMGATRIFSISTEPPKLPFLPTYPENFKPNFSTMLRFMRKILGQDFSTSEAAQLNVLNRFASELTTKWNPFEHKKEINNSFFDSNYAPKDYETIEVFQMHPSKSPEVLFREFWKGENGTTKKKSSRTFMFHRDFIKNLIDLGYEDAKQKHSALEAFFSNISNPKDFHEGATYERK